MTLYSRSTRLIKSNDMMMIELQVNLCLQALKEFGNTEVEHETRVVGKKRIEYVMRRSLIIPRVTGIA